MAVSHAGAQPAHIHYVVQPATREAMEEFGEYGPQLTTAMFARNETPPVHEVDGFADRARTVF
jgi:hypothetical protein